MSQLLLVASDEEKRQEGARPQLSHSQRRLKSPAVVMAFQGTPVSLLPSSALQWEGLYHVLS